MTDEHLRELVALHGVGAKLARAVIREMDWHGGTGGYPAEWYQAFRGWLGDRLERVLAPGITLPSPASRKAP